MPVLNRISTIKVLFAVLGDRELAKAVLAACNSQAQYLQPCQKVNHLQPGEGKNKVFPLPLPRSLLGKAKQSAAQYLLKETPRHQATSSPPFGTDQRQKLCLSVVSSVIQSERLNPSLRQKERLKGNRKPGLKADFPRNTQKLLLSLSSDANDFLQLLSQLPTPPFPAPCCCMPSHSSSIKFGFCSMKQLGQATRE